MFKKYLQIAKTAWLEYLEFRANLFFEILGGVVTALVILFLWIRVYSDSPDRLIGGYSLSEMITYIIGAGIIYSFIFLTGQGDEIDDDIRLGNLSNYLLKPFSIFGYWLTKDLLRKFFTLCLGGLGYVFVLFFFRGDLVLPKELATWGLLLLSIFLAGILHFLVFYLFSIIAFWLEQTWGFRFVIRVIMEIATGVIIPVTLLPGVLGDVIRFLPFKFFAFFPMQIFLNKLTYFEIFQNLGFVLIWIGVFYAICLLVWRRGLKYYTAVGG